MSTRPLSAILAPVMGRYLALKTDLGRRYAGERAVLQSLDAFLKANNADDLTHDVFERWGLSQSHLKSGVRRHRMRIIRNLCLYRRRTEPSCFVPDPDLFPPPHQYVQPYIFTEEDIARLIQATSTLRTTRAYPLRSRVFRLAVALLYTTGLRRGELLRMTVGDYGLHERTLLVRASKFHKSRLLPLSGDAAREIQDYLTARRAHGPDAMADQAPLLWNGSAIVHSYTGPGFVRVFRGLLRRAGIHKPDGQLPRVHDVRHSFAMNALLRWYRAGVDVQAKLPLLATYMGHVSIVSTQYYLHFIEPLTRLASARFAKHCGGLVIPTPKPIGGDR